MSDRREEIFKEGFGILSVKPTDTLKRVVFSAMDEYMKESCLSLLQYMADNSITLSLASLPEDPLFSWKGRLLTKDELFENFL